MLNTIAGCTVVIFTSSVHLAKECAFELVPNPSSTTNSKSLRTQGKLEESEKLVVAERNKNELLEKEVECLDSEAKSVGMMVECRKSSLVS